MSESVQGADPNAAEGEPQRTQIEPTQVEFALKMAAIQKINVTQLPPGQFLPTQDLSGDRLILSADRIEFHGQKLPSLGGIPLICKLGQGGMGAVYYGVHQRLNKEVAVKVLPFNLAESQPEMVQRFFREAQIAAMVQSPYLVSVMDVNDDKGLFFLVMEFVGGDSAGAYLRKTKKNANVVGLSIATALDICIAATKGIAAAHEAGIIHRDIKPDNILIPMSRATGDMQFKNSKVADLGLARGEDLGQSLTMGNACMGTPGYMAPEQALDAKRVHKSADIFSMGATLYSLMGGCAPFTGSTPINIVLETAQSPHTPIGILRDDVPAQLVAIIDRCLEKSPAKRYADGNELLEALEAIRPTIHAAPAPGPKAPSAIPNVRAINVNELIEDARHLVGSNPEAALEKIAEIEKRAQANADAGLTLLTGPSHEAADLRRQAEQAIARRSGGSSADFFQALANAIPIALNAKKDGEWDIVIAALEGPLQSLGNSDHPNRGLAEKLLEQARQRSGSGASTTAAPSSGSGLKIDLGAGVLLELVALPAGTFTMGSPPTEKGRSANEIPHAVTFTRPLHIGKFAVTQAQYEQVMGANPSEFKGRDNPAENVTWDDCLEFCRRVAEKTGTQLRLPTEAEWEYACRAGTSTPFHFGEIITPDQANYDGNFNYESGPKGVYRQKTTPCGSFPPNAWGLYDMHGNIWEWCHDWYAAYPNQALTDPQGPAAGKHRVMRGGSWNYRPALCRSATRYWDAPAERSSRRGFRVAVSG
jgi:formylglycine-generating enzyme required for sulfatase activity/tRNA A-37 threonylcarbamoyl transferase component Bud32